MAKQKKQKQGLAGAEGAAESGKEGSHSVRHQKLCVAIDMEQESIVGHTEMQVVIGKSRIAELHSGGVDIAQVFIDGAPAKFEKKQSTPASSQQASPRLQSVQEAAATAYSRYTAALDRESAPDIFVTLPTPSPAHSENAASEHPERNESTQETGTKPSTDNDEEVVKLQVQFYLRKPKTKLFFSPKLFQTHRARHWFPCLGSLSSKCRYCLEFTVNNEYVAVSAGSLHYQVVSKEDTHMKTYVYELEIPTPACFITLVVAPLEILSERQNSSITHMCPPGCIAKLRSSVNCYNSLFSLYEEYLECSFPFGCYKQVFIDSEHAVASVAIGASSVTLSSHLLVDERVIDQAIITQIKLAQALAQQWFGVFITPETDRDVWLLEGISGFLVHLFIRKFLGNNEAQFRKFKAIGAVTEADVDSFPALSPSSVPANVHMAEKHGLLGRIRLWKAVAVIQMLEKQMGPELFRKVLQRIVSKRNSRTLSTKEFRQLANKIGNLERPFLKEFFPRWVESQGSPLLRMGFEYNKRRNLVEFAVQRDCTAPGVMMAGNKSAADIGWPGMMNIQIHELDGMYDHPNLSLSGDVHQLLELPCHSKLANRRPQRPKKPGKVEIIDDLADDKPSVESPLLWVRADPGMDYLAKIQLWQPEQMWINQLERDKDVVAQIQAITALQKMPNTFAIVNAFNNCLIDSKVFCRVRIEAAFALANTAAEATSWSGLGHLIKYYKSRCFDAEIGLPRSNNFHDFSEYFVLQAVPLAIGSVRANQGKSPPEAVEFILSILKHNDNSGNAYSDSYWLSSIIESVGELEISQQSMPKFARILKQVDRYLQYDRLMPSYNYILTRSCIRTLTRLALKFNTVVPSEPLQKLFSPFKDVSMTPWQIRLTTLQALLDMTFHLQGLNATLRSALDFVNEEPCTRVQSKVIAHVLRICLKKNAAASVIEGSTLSALLDMFGSERCAMNHKLRHHVFIILQVLAGKPATLMRPSKLPPKGPLPPTPATEVPVARKIDAKEAIEPSKFKLRVIEPKVAKVKVRVKTSAFQNSDTTNKPPATPTVTQAGESKAAQGGDSKAQAGDSKTMMSESDNTETIIGRSDQPQIAKAASSSNQVADDSNQPGPDKMEIEQMHDASSRLKTPMELMEVKTETTEPESESQMVTLQAVQQNAASESQKHKKEKKDKKKKEKDKKDRKEKKDKDKKERDKKKKHKKEKRKHEELGQAKQENDENGAGTGEDQARQPNILLQVKQEISDANMAMEVKKPEGGGIRLKISDPSMTAGPVEVKKPEGGGFKLKIKRPKMDP